MKSSLRVLLVDDYSPFRDFLRETLQQIPGFEVVGEAFDGRDAVLKAQGVNPDLIVLDLGLPKLNGIEVIRRIRTLSEGTKILVLSETRAWAIIEEAFRSGAGGYVVKSDAGCEFWPAVEAVLSGTQFISSSAVRSVIAECNHAGAEAQSPSRSHTKPWIRRACPRCRNLSFRSEDI